MNDFRPTPLENVLHKTALALGIFSIVTSPIVFVYLFQTRRKAETGGKTYRWFLFSITMVCAIMDVHISILFAPYPLMPHVGGWADGLLAFHPRSMVYLVAVAIALAFGRFTTLPASFLYRLHVLESESMKRVVKRCIYASVILCTANSLFSDGILLIVYPSNERVANYVIENVPDVSFILNESTFIYFSKLDKYHWAIIGMTHFACVGIAIVLSFTLTYWRIIKRLELQRSFISAQTMKMHRMLIRSLKVQLVLPMALSGVPCATTGASIKFGSPNGAVDHQLLAYFALLIFCIESPLNTISMFLAVPPFQRFILRKKDKIQPQNVSRTITLDARASGSQLVASTPLS